MWALEERGQRSPTPAAAPAKREGRCFSQLLVGARDKIRRGSNVLVVQVAGCGVALLLLCRARLEASEVRAPMRGLPFPLDRSGKPKNASKTTRGLLGLTPVAHASIPHKKKQ